MQRVYSQRSKVESFAGVEHACTNVRLTGLLCDRRLIETMRGAKIRPGFALAP